LNDGTREAAMATRAEAAKAEAARKGAQRAPATRQAMDKSAIETHASGRAARKASYALEERAEDGRASRKSTRGSRNRAKPDAQLDARQELVKSSPTSRFRSAKARATRVRGRP